MYQTQFNDMLDTLDDMTSTRSEIEAVAQVLAEMVETGHPGISAGGLVDVLTSQHALAAKGHGGDAVPAPAYPKALDDAEATIIFAIDNGSDPRFRARFERHIDTQRAMGKLAGPMLLATGMWEGVMEGAYIMTLKDYLAHVAPRWVQNQDCVLVTRRGEPCMLTEAGGVMPTKNTLGPLVVKPFAEAIKSPGWTYVHALDEYWVAE